MAKAKKAKAPAKGQPAKTPNPGPARAGIRRLEWIEAGTLAENPRNWRRHPKPQLDQLRALMDDPDVGFAGALLFNETTGHLIDGHARRGLVDPAEAVPVLVGAWSTDAEAKILLTLDPITALAEANEQKLAALQAATAPALERTGLTPRQIKDLAPKIPRGSAKALAAAVKAETERTPSKARDVEEIVSHFAGLVRALADKAPDKLDKAIGLVVPFRGRSIFVLVDNAVADALAELKRYADAGESSPLEALLAASIPLAPETPKE